MVHAGASLARPSLDGSRIAASAGAILFNGAVLLLLLVPLSAPQLVERVLTTPIQVVTVQRERVVVAPPPPTTAPVVVRFDPSRSTSRIAIVQPPAAQVASSQTMEAVVPSLPTDTVAAGTGTQVATYLPPAAIDATPLSGARLAYAYAPAPPYPADALREGRSGTVILEVLVGLDGRPVSVEIAQSSGQRDLDRIAVRHVLAKWRFEPAMRNGQAVQAIGRVPIAFSLD